MFHTKLLAVCVTCTSFVIVAGAALPRAISDSTQLTTEAPAEVVHNQIGYTSQRTPMADGLRYTTSTKTRELTH